MMMPSTTINRIQPPTLLQFLFFMSCAVVVMFLPSTSVHAQDGSSELLPEKSASSLQGRGSRVRCTDESLKLYANATACADEREPESCRMIFSVTASSNPATRDPKCDNPLLKDLSEQCRRTCAICCEDPSYACQNDESGIVNCNQNMEKCGMSEFSPMMVKFCPATCGLCLAKKCHDQIPTEDCKAMKSLCTNEIYATFMEHQCARTCGKCKVEDGSDVDEPETSGGGSGGHGGGGGGLAKELVVGGGGGGGGGGNEVDGGGDHSKEAAEKPDEEIESIIDPMPAPHKKKHEKCVDLIKTCARNKRFCHHPSYKLMMQKNCAKTCGFCKPDEDEEKGGGGEDEEEEEHSSPLSPKDEKRKKGDKGGKSPGSKRGNPGATGGAETGHHIVERNGDGDSDRHHIVARDCHDKHPFCKGWVNNGYCDSDDYTDEEKKEKCAKTCKFC